jgi:hypothetical protein
MILRIIVGIIVIVLIVLGVLTWIGTLVFNKYVEEEVSYIASGISEQAPWVFAYDDLPALPDQVKTYLKYALRDGQEEIRFVRLKQRGIYKPQEAGDWSYIEAEQYYATEDPAFVWVARMRAAPLIRITAMDEYYEGKGTIIIKLISALTLRTARGRELDVSQMVRFFSEALWFPTALLPSEYVSWQDMGGSRAKVTLSVHGLKASGIFTFNEQGQITSFETRDRYRESGGRYYKEQWKVYYKDYKEFDGVRIPSKIEAEWNLENWNYKYASLTVDDVEYDVPARFEKE